MAPEYLVKWISEHAICQKKEPILWFKKKTLGKCLFGHHSLINSNVLALAKPSFIHSFFNQHLNVGKFLKKSFWSKSWVYHICQQLLISELWISDPLPSTLPKLHTSQSQATSRVSISSVTLGSFDLLFNAWWSRYITYASVIACFCIFTMFSEIQYPFRRCVIAPPTL